MHSVDLHGKGTGGRAWAARQRRTLVSYRLSRGGGAFQCCFIGNAFCTRRAAACAHSYPGHRVCMRALGSGSSAVAAGPPLLMHVCRSPPNVLQTLAPPTSRPWLTVPAIVLHHPAGVWQGGALAQWSWLARASWQQPDSRAGATPRQSQAVERAVCRPSLPPPCPAPRSLTAPCLFSMVKPRMSLPAAHEGTLPAYQWGVPGHHARLPHARGPFLGTSSCQQSYHNPPL